jgi:hypothetical protein
LINRFKKPAIKKDPRVDVDALVEAAMFEIYQQEVQNLEQALDLSKNVLDPAKIGLGNSPLRPGPEFRVPLLLRNTV